MNPLYKDKVFLCIAIPAFFILLWSTVGVTVSAWNEYKWVLWAGTEEWANLAALYKVPLSIAAGLFAVFALFTSIHRLVIQSAQMEDARKLNEFNIFFKQREEFDKKFSEPMLEWSKSLIRDRDLRHGEFFSDFDPSEVLKNNYDDELLKKNSKVVCLRLYEFCFGNGRRVFLSKEFTLFLEECFADLVMLRNLKAADSANLKVKINCLVKDRLIVGGRVTSWGGVYESEWFSDNEKFHFSLAIFRLLCEIEAFAGSPRDMTILSDLFENGNSIEHAYFYGPCMTLGERELSPGGKAGRRPHLLSHILKEREKELNKD